MNHTRSNQAHTELSSLRSGAFIACILLITTFFAWRILHDPFFTETDLSVWQRDWMELEICTSKSQNTCGSISKYPFAYLLNSGAANLLAGRTHIDQWWGGLRDKVTLLNISTCAISLLVATYTSKPKERLSILVYCITILLTPLPDFYVRSGSLEVQSGIFFSLFALYIHRHISSGSSHSSGIYKSALPLFLGCLYKDTYSLVWIFIGMATWAIALKKKKTVGERKVVSLIHFSLATLSGGWASLIVSLGFNRYRYVSIFPAEYLKESALTRPEAVQSLKFLIASIFSPNGGLLSFWGLAVGALIILLVTTKRFTLKWLLLSSCFPTICLLLHSLWWAPFGWDSWGNRLLIPSMMFMLATLSLQLSKPYKSKPVKKRMTTTKRSLLATISAISIILISSNYIAKPFANSKKSLWDTSLHSHSSCDLMINKLVRTEHHDHHLIWKSKIYYNCAHDRFWAQYQ